MPYEYRKLSPVERKQIVEERKRRGYPLHQPPHPYQEGGSFLITAANYEHKHLMATPERRTQIANLLNEGFRGINAEIYAWVVLPNHYHISVGVASFTEISDIIKQIHGSTSRLWNIEDSMTGRRKVWYRFYDRMIHNELQLNQAINYIHFNPVKHGYVKDGFDWLWSSLSGNEE
jgi:putative transposase